MSLYIASHASAGNSAPFLIHSRATSRRRVLVSSRGYGGRRSAALAFSVQGALAPDLDKDFFVRLLQLRDDIVRSGVALLSDDEISEELRSLRRG